MVDNIYSDIFCLVKQEEKYDALREIISSCSIFSTLPEDLDKFTSSVINREKKLSTDVGHGVAITHGKVPHLERTLIALGLSKEGIEFKNDGEKVHLIFVIASPLAANSDYLKGVALLLTWLHDIEFRNELLSLKDTDNVKRFLEMLQTQQYISFRGKA